MEIYLVGGAVRDLLLNKPSQDRDWVVVGGSPREMLDRGYLQVGADFPVFLDPATDEEYALARQERKAGVGYHGFVTETEGVTLEDDLSRRDLTINAMAMSSDDVLIDPFNGQADLQNRVLRHVGPAFEEDPVRILRLLRFLARFGPTWTIARETRALVRSMVGRGVAGQLVAERVWKEVSRGLMEPHPELMLQGLRSFGLLQEPCFAAYASAHCNAESWLRSAASAQAPLELRFALAFPQASSAPPLGIPRPAWRLAKLLKTTEGRQPRTADDWLHLMVDADAFRESSLWESLLFAWQVQGLDTQVARRVGQSAQAVDVKALSSSMPPGPAVGKAIQATRRAAVQAVL